MIDYVVESNIDDRILAKACQILQTGGLLCFPTETNWVVVCNPFNKSAVDKLYRLRHIENSKHLTVLCCNFQKAMEIAFINDNAFRLMKKVVPGSFTFIFEAKKKITKFLKASKIDHQVGIRFPPGNLARSIIVAFDEVLLSTHLSHDMVEGSDPDIPLYSALIEDQFGDMIDLIIDPGETEFIGPTTVINFTTPQPEVLRVGLGNPMLFQK
jgi:tRNA threonylcarbamoyl adenosine modification protein (Sua5/YciO/YrdC/YwlC family)